MSIKLYEFENSGIEKLEFEKLRFKKCGFEKLGFDEFGFENLEFEKFRFRNLQKFTLQILLFFNCSDFFERKKGNGKLFLNQN